MSNNPPNTTQEIAGPLNRYAWLLIPLQIVVITGLWVADPQTTYQSTIPWLLLNLIFTWLLSLAIGYVAARGFLANGQPGLLMLGCGALLWGFTNLAAAKLIDSSHNLAITVHSLGVLGSALCHFGGLLWSGGLSRPGRWLMAGYSTILAIVALVVWAALAGWPPLFFVLGQGGTPVRHFVLLLSIVLLVITAGLMLTSNQLRPSRFVYWYSLGLTLQAVGLTGLMLQSFHGSPLNWVGRITQDLGGGYLLFAAIMAARETGTWKISLTGINAIWRGNLFLAKPRQPSTGWVARYGLAVLTVVAAMALRLALEALLTPGLPPYLTFYPAVMLAALLAGFAPGLVATALSGLIAACWILPPAGQFTITTPIDRMGLVLFIGLGLGMSLVAEFYRHHREKAAAYDREAVLRDAKARLATFAEATFEGIAESCAGRIIDCNEQLARILGYPVAELQGREITSFIAPEDRERVMANISQGREAVIEYTMLRQDGTPIVVEAHSRSVSPESLLRYTAIRNITRHKQLERALVQVKEEWERTFDSVPDLIAILDERYRIVRTNRAMALRLRRTPEESIGLACHTCVHDLNGPPAFCPHAQTLKDGKKHTVEVHEDCLGGDFLITTTPLKDINERIIGTVHIARDITDQKRREAELHKLNRTLKARTRSSEAMTHATEEAAYLQEVCTIIAEDCGHVVVWIGYAQDDAELSVRPVARYGCNVELLETLRITWADTERGRGPTGTAIRTGRMSICRDTLTDPTVAPWREEAFKLGYASAIAFPLKAEGRCFGAISIYSNQLDPFTEDEVMLLTELADNLAYGITALRSRVERAEAMESLRIRERQFKTLTEVSPSGIWRNDARGGYTYVSARWSEITGIPAQAATGFGWSAGIHPEDQERVVGEWLRAIQAAAVYQSEFRYVKPDGEVIWVLCIARRRKDARPKNRIWVGTITDISALKRTEDRLSAALAEKEVLLREVHHRVKNNLAAIIGLMDMQRMLLDDPQSREALADLSSRIRSMSLVHEMLYRAESLTNVDFEEYLRDLVFRLRSSLCAPHVTFEVEARGIAIPVDLAVPCGMIVNEIITNALKYAFPARKPRPGNECCLIRVTMRHDHDTYRLSVADNGVGLPPGFDWTKGRTLGMILIRMLGQHQLGGSYRLDQTEGTRWTLTFTALKGGNNG